MNRILDALRTPSAMLVALLLALIAQLEHTAQVFSQVVNASGVYATVHAYAFAIAVETAVLLFVLHEHKRISYMFAVATFATNLSYYAMHRVDLLSIAGAPAWLMAGLLPACIVGYSHVIAQPATSQAAAKPAPRRWWIFGRKPVEAAATNVEPFESGKTPVALPMGILSHSSESLNSDELAQKGDLPAMPPQQPQDVPTVDAKTRAMQLHSEGYSPAEIARMVNAKYPTVQSWLRRSNAQTNGVHQ